MPIVKPRGGPGTLRVDRDRLYRVAIIFGLCLLTVSLTNLFLVWSAGEFGVPQWQLSATTGTFARLPLLVLAQLLIGIGAAYGEWPLGTRLAGWGLILTAAGVVLVAGLYALAVQVSLELMPTDMVGQLRLSAIKNAVNVGVYVATCMVTGILLLRSVRRSGRAQ